MIEGIKNNEDKLDNFHQIVFLYVDVETKEEIIELINKKFNDIGHTFTTHRYNDEDDDEIMLEDMGYDY